MRTVLLALLLACGSPGTGDLTAVDPGTPAMSVWLDGAPTDGGGRLVVQVSVPDGADIELPELDVKGLEFEEQDEPRVEQLGQRTVLTRRYRYTGNANSYEVPSLSAKWTTTDQSGEVASDPLWIDIGVDGPDVGELRDIQDPKALWAQPVNAVAVAIFVLVALMAAFLGGRWMRRKPPPERRTIAMRPDKKALMEWLAARNSTVLDDYDKAVELSRIFREYAEAVLGFPAQKNTTPETLQILEGLTHLPEGNVARAKRLLRATDMVKYADQAISEDFFEDLDADLRAFIDSTRPVNWTGEAAEAEAA